MTKDLVRHPKCIIDRNRESQAFGRKALGASEHRGVDPYDPPFAVEQRAPRIPRVDRGVGLNQIGERNTPLRIDGKFTPEGADDPCRHRVVETKGVTDGDDELTDSERLTPGQLRPGQVVPLNPQHSEVRFWVRPDESPAGTGGRPGARHGSGLRPR